MWRHGRSRQQRHDDLCLGELVPVPSAVGYLAITPFDADIYIDGTYYGNGQQTIACSRHLYARAEKGRVLRCHQQFTIIPGNHDARTGMTPYPSAVTYGDIQVQSTPSGAAVFLNGNYQGTTYAGSPLDITQLSPGTYRPAHHAGLPVLYPDRCRPGRGSDHVATAMVRMWSQHRTPPARSAYLHSCRCRDLPG